MTHELKRCDIGLKGLDEKGVVTFYFNAFDNVDSDNDMSRKGAFLKTMNDQKGRIKHFKNHNIYQTPGVISEMGEDEKGAWARSQLILGTTLGKETYEEYKAGAITEHSFGYDVVKSVKNPSGFREIIEYKLWEVSSLNAWGANSQTNVIDVKNEKQLLFELDKLLKLSKGDFTDEYLSKIETKINEILTHLKTLRETTITECKNCGHKFDYLGVSESGMGYVLCPNCKSVVTQSDKQSEPKPSIDAIVKQFKIFN